MHFSTQVDISAPAAVVWEVMADVTRWHEWTESIRSIEWVQGTSLAVGAVARIRQPQIPAASWEVTAVEPGRSFTWRTQNMGMSFVASHVIEEAPAGVRVTLTLDIAGVVAVFMRPMLSAGIPRALAMESQGLKRRSEERAAFA